MAIMKWGTPPGGNQNDRKAHVVGHGDGVALQHAVRGAKVEGGGNNDDTNPNHGSAVKWSTAPYTGPTVATIERETPNPWGYRSPKRAKRCMANDDTCMAWATAKSNYEYCNPHWRQSQGLTAWPSNEEPDPEPEPVATNVDPAELFGDD